MKFTDKELNVLIAEFYALSEFLDDPEGKRGDSRQIRNILKKAIAEKKARANTASTGRRAPRARKNRVSGEEWLARFESTTPAASNANRWLD